MSTADCSACHAQNFCDRRLQDLDLAGALGRQPRGGGGLTCQGCHNNNATTWRSGRDHRIYVRPGARCGRLESGRRQPRSWQPGHPRLQRLPYHDAAVYRQHRPSNHVRPEPAPIARPTVTRAGLRRPRPSWTTGCLGFGHGLRDLPRQGRRTVLRTSQTQAGGQADAATRNGGGCRVRAITSRWARARHLQYRLPYGGCAGDSGFRRLLVPRWKGNGHRPRRGGVGCKLRHLPRIGTGLVPGCDRRQDQGASERHHTGQDCGNSGCHTGQYNGFNAGCAAAPRGRPAD